MKTYRIQRYFSNCWSFMDGIEYNSYENAEKAIKEHYPEQDTRIINMEEEEKKHYMSAVMDARDIEINQLKEKNLRLEQELNATKNELENQKQSFHFKGSLFQFKKLKRMGIFN